MRESLSCLFSIGVLAILGLFAGSRADAGEHTGHFRHVVCFKFKEGTSPAEVTEIEKEFGALKGKIETIIDYEWGTSDNIEPLNDGYTHCFVVTFKDKKGLEVYLPHPDHKAFVDLLKPKLDKVFVIDYTARVKMASRRMVFAGLLGWCACLILAAPGAAQAADSLEDFEIFQRSAGEWEGIGVSFDIVNGELREPVTFRDRWEARLKDENLLMEMRGTTRAGGRRIGYLWRFRWQTKSGKITGEFENSEGVASAVDVKPVAEGKRIEIRTPESEADTGGMRMDIYLEDDDIVIESTILDAEGNATYRAAARYRKAE